MDNFNDRRDINALCNTRILFVALLLALIQSVLISSTPLANIITYYLSDLIRLRLKASESII